MHDDAASLPDAATAPAPEVRSGADLADLAPDGRPSMIVAEGLVKRFGDATAVDGVDLDVRRGEIFGFLGPNGAGKTTTIRMLTGLVTPTSGRALIGGHDVALEPIPARAIMAYLPDTPYLYDKLTGREFVHFVAGLYRVPPDRAARRLEELLPLFDLADRADDLIEGYSHGMRQKTLMVAALVHDPAVLILDEPTVGLDPRSARLIRDILRRLADGGTTVFLSTHILEIAERMCDRIAIIHQGRIVAQGTMDALRRIARQNETLEDIFLEVTGGAAVAELARVLA